MILLQVVPTVNVQEEEDYMKQNQWHQYLETIPPNITNLSNNNYMSSYMVNCQMFTECWKSFNIYLYAIFIFSGSTHCWRWLVDKFFFFLSEIGMHPASAYVLGRLATVCLIMLPVMGTLTILSRTPHIRETGSFIIFMKAILGASRTFSTSVSSRQAGRSNMCSAFITEQAGRLFPLILS